MSIPLSEPLDRLFVTLGLILLSPKRNRLHTMAPNIAETDVLVFDIGETKLPSRTFASCLASAFALLG